MTLDDYCSQLGSTSPTPGGGSAAGLTLSLGAASAEKAARFSLKETHSQFIDIFAGIRADGLKLSEEDMLRFVEWNNARKLPKDTEEQKTFRKNECDKAAAECARVPLKTAEFALKLLETVDKFLPTCNKFLVSDAACAASFASAAFEASIFNIMVNLPYIGETNFSGELKQFMNDKVSYFSELKDSILRECEKMLK